MRIITLISILILLSCEVRLNQNPKQTALINKESEKMIFDDSIDADKIVQIKEIPYIDNCNDIIFWSLVQQKNNIPELIQKLTDETVLKDVYVPNFGGEYTVADVSLSILNEKIKGIPVFELIGRRFSEDCGYCSYWYFVRENKENRLLLQQNFKKWCQENEHKLVWVNSNYSLTGDCNSPVNGHYEIKK